jgi:hypothetical protein
MLKVRDNQLKWLPVELGQMPKLTELWVRRSGSFDLAR